MTDVEDTGSSKGSEQELKAITSTQKRSNKNRLIVVLLVVAAIVVVLALALGLGLGLGLRAKRSKNDAVTSADPLSTVDPTQQVLSRSWDAHAPAQVRQFNFTVSLRRGAPGGNAKDLLVVNGISPGPLIEANLGDQVVVNVHNTLNTTTAVHWHGQYQNGTNRMDGTFGITECGIAPGSTFTYNWTVQNVGTYWWHAHKGLQYSDGMYGPLILHGPNETTYANNIEGEQVIMAADMYNDAASTYLAGYQSVNGPPGGQLGDEPVPDCGVVNGLGICAGGEANARTSNLTGFERGKQYRFRLINAGSLATIRFALDGHTMTVIEADGTPIEPQTVQSVNVMVAQRYSVLINMDQAPSAYTFHAELLTDMFGYDKPGLVTDQRATLFYEGVSTTTAPANVTTAPSNVTDSLDTTTLKPLEALTPPAATKQDTLTISFGLASDSLLHAFLNDSSWSATQGEATLYDVVAAQRNNAQFSPQQLVLSNDGPVVYDLILNNEDDGEHPVHLHGYNPWILGSGDGHFQYGKSLDLSQTFNNPMRRDTFSVPTYGWTAIRVVLDNPGVWALHCHIAWHMEVGFLSQLNVLPGRLAQQSIDKNAATQCGKSSLV